MDKQGQCKVSAKHDLAARGNFTSDPTYQKLLLLFIWLLILILSFGTINEKSLLNRADGWLVDLPQPEYNARTNDTSQPFEAGASGGTPALQTLQFSVT
jgi:hypothetical protein